MDIKEEMASASASMDGMNPQEWNAMKSGTLSSAGNEFGYIHLVKTNPQSKIL